MTKFAEVISNALGWIGERELLLGYGVSDGSRG
jgi:hypothetical protein